MNPQVWWFMKIDTDKVAAALARVVPETRKSSPREIKRPNLCLCSLSLMVILRNFVVIPIEILRRGSLFNSMILYINYICTILCPRLEKANYAVTIS